MAKKNTAVTETPEDNAQERTEPIDVAGQDALGLASAYAGLYHLFDARVESWDVTTDGLVAHNFTVDSEYDPELIVKHINLKNRRAPLFPAILSIINPNVAPPEFENALEVTTFMVNFWKGSMGEDSSKVPEYVRTAASRMKERNGTKVRKGPKIRTLNLKNVKDFNVDTLKNAGISREDIEYLISVSQSALDSVDNTESPADDAEIVETVNA